MPTAFVAGATGYTGRALMRAIRTREDGVEAAAARAHGRQARRRDAVVCDPRDVAALTAGMRGCDAVVQLIGTVKARFAEGDYDDIDYGTTVALGEAAKAAGVPRLLLLSSVGAGSPRGRYLAVKRKTEEWVERSGLEYTIVRPSVIVGEGRRGAQVLGRADVCRSRRCAASRCTIWRACFCARSSGATKCGIRFSRGSRSGSLLQ